MDFGDFGVYSLLFSFFAQNGKFRVFSKIDQLNKFFGESACLIS